MNATRTPPPSVEAALNALDKADDLNAFLTWVASARELDRHVHARISAGAAAGIGGLPPASDFSDAAASGLAWVYLQQGEALAEARNALTAITSTT